jgi:Tfp pilus assembly protein PilV
MRSRPGFGLVEGLMALAIIAAVAIAVLSLSAAHLSIVAKEVAYLDAGVLAQAKLAETRLLPASRIAELRGAEAEGTFAPPYDHFAWNVRVIRDGAGADVVQVTVESNLARLMAVGAAGRHLP